MNRDLIAMRSEDKQAQANKHIYIYMHKNITPYKIKTIKACSIKSSSLLRLREEKKRQTRSYGLEVIRVYTKQVLIRIFNSTYSHYSTFI
jgi:hypothetical protein